MYKSGQAGRMIVFFVTTVLTKRPDREDHESAVLVKRAGISALLCRVSGTAILLHHHQRQ